MSGARSLLAALLLAAVLAGAALAGSRAAADEYSDATLEAFVTVSIEVSRRIEAWRPQIEETADEGVREALIEEAQADIARAIEEAEGIGEDDFYAIFEAAREDEALRARIGRLLSARVPRRRAAHRGTRVR